MLGSRFARLPGPPVFVLDDMVLDGTILNPRFLADYVARRLEGRKIFAREELFLMRR